MKSRTSHAEKFRLNLLGEFALITSSGDGMAISAKKSKALLAYLALSQSGTSSRDRIAGLLWSDTELTFAKTNLRQCLSALRKQLDNPTNQLITSRADQLTLDMTKIELETVRA
jgi:DNA-binding SARP family transcriptional activator